MKKLIFTLSMACMAFMSHAQVYYPDGTVISSTVVMKDINNVSYDLFTMLNAGKHVIIDLSATWCGPCWSYHQSHVLDNYYDKYGPTGTSVKDAQVIFYEVDNATTMADLQGTTAASQGDWLTGTTHPVCNEMSTGAVESKFVQPGQSYGIPAVFVVCKDKKLYKISTSLTTETGLRSFISSKCGVGPLSTNDVMDLDFSYNIYPNPSSSNTTVHVALDSENTVSLSVTNSLGQVVHTQAEARYSAGDKNIELNTATWANGLYFANLKVGNRIIQAKIVVAH